MATMARRDAVLDSSILIQHTRVREKRKSFFIRSLRLYNPCISVITVYELEFGAYRAGRASDIEDLRTSFKILLMTEAIARSAARLDANLIRENIQIGIKDTFIAATCLEHGLPLLSMNVRHFDRVPGLQLISLNSLPEIAA